MEHNIKSNLRIIKITYFARPKKKKKKKKFRFEEFWLREEECKKIVELNWNISLGSDPFSTLCGKIGSTRKALLQWSRNLFGKIKEAKIIPCTERLNHQSQPPMHLSCPCKSIKIGNYNFTLILLYVHMHGPCREYLP